MWITDHDETTESGSVTCTRLKTLEDVGKASLYIWKAFKWLSERFPETPSP